MQPQRIRNTVELYPPMIVHRLILLLPIAYGGWCVWRGHELPLLFWCILAGTVLFHLFAKCPPYLRLSPTGLKFTQTEAPEILWSDLKQVKSGPSGMDLTLISGEVVRVEYAQLRARDVDRLREMVKAQILAISAEVKTLMAADPLSAVVNTNLVAVSPRSASPPAATA